MIYDNFQWSDDANKNGHRDLEKSRGASSVNFLLTAVPHVTSCLGDKNMDPLFKT